MKENEIWISRLREATPDRRMDFLEELTFDIDDSAAEALLQVAESDEPEELRADVLISLGPTIDECGTDYEADFGFGPELTSRVSKPVFESMVARIRRIYEDPSQPTIVRRRAFEVLVRDPQPWQKEAIRRDFASGNREWQLTALFSMAFHPGFDREILNMVELGEGDLREEAVRTAGSRGLREAGPALRKLARSPNTSRDLRISAILALPSVDERSRDLLEDLARSSDRQVAEAAREALDELGTWGIEEDFDEDDELEEEELEQEEKN